MRSITTVNENRQNHSISLLCFLGLAFWWAWAYVAFYSGSLFPTAATTPDASRDTWIASCIGYIITLGVAILLDKHIGTISSHRYIMAASPLLTSLGTIVLASAYRQTFLDAWTFAIFGGFITGIGTAWLSLAWGELFGSIGMNKTARFVTLSLFSGLVLYYILISIPAVVCIPITVILPIVSMTMLMRSFHTRPLLDPERPCNDIVPRSIPLKFILNIGAIGIAFGYLQGIGLVGNTNISPYVLFLGITIVAMILAIWTNLLQRDLNVALIYRTTMVILIAGFMSIPFVQGNALGLSATVVTACYDCFDMVVWAIMANIVALSSASAIRTFGLGRLSNHTGMVIGVFGGILVQTNVEYYSPLPYLISTVIVFILVVCIFLATKEITFFTTSPRIVSRMSTPNKDIEVACTRITEQYGLTPREKDVLELLARGRNAPYIAEALIISDNTVKTHAKHIYRKLDINTQQQLINLVENANMVKREDRTSEVDRSSRTSGT